jgi:hypothetical protein
MRIEKKEVSAEIWVSFTEEDFRLKTPDNEYQWILAKEDLKRMIPTGEIWYDPYERKWIIKDTHTNNAAIDKINEKYFIDKDQLRFFND